MSSLVEQFAAAQANVTKLKDDPGNMEKLKLYAQFKQATVGKNATAKPGMLDFVKKAKWDAWAQLGDMSKDDAMKEYVKTVDALIKEKGLAGGESEAKSKSTAESTKSKAAANDTPADTWVMRKIDGKIFNIQLNRPDKKNALTPEMYDRITALLKESAQCHETSITVINAAGDMYCSGNDLSNFTGAKIADPQQMAKASKELLHRFVQAFIDHPKPLVALVQGPAVGIAVTTLGLCDVVYCSDRATFHTPFSSLGQSPEGCSAALFPRTMGLSKANEVLLFGKKLTAGQACDRGLVAEVFPDGSFEKEAWARVKGYSKLPPLSMRYSKQVVRNTYKKLLDETNTAECARLEERWISEECINAIMHFFAQQKEKKSAKAKL